MAVRGIYNEAQQQMLEATNKTADTMVGWFKSPARMVATEESMKMVAHYVDYWNPLWRDENYAANTRWGGLIAFPFYQERFGATFFSPETTPEVGFHDYTYIGDDWELFRPVRAGDRLRVWFNRPTIEDITSLDGKGPLTFKVVVSDLCHINQNDELVSTFKRYLQCAYLPEPPEKSESMPESKYRYSKEELDHIGHLAESEEVRGAAIRYWEDVEIGDEPKPVVIGPSTTAIIQRAGILPVPMREMFKRTPWEFVQDPETGVYHASVEVHQSDLGARLFGRPQAFHYGPLARDLMARLATNWMGDDGFLRAFKFRHMAQTPIGDTVIARGKVVGKRAEKGEHLVDLAIWLDNIRGNVVEAATATVSLCTRENPFKWK